MDVRIRCRSPLLPWAALAAAFLGCAGPTTSALPAPPQAEAKEPPLGRVLKLELEAAGQPLLLEAVVGRVTVLCVLGEGGDRIVDVCRNARLFWGDRIAVVGLSTAADRGFRQAPFRVYADPDGTQLRSVLSLGPDSVVIVTDRRGRVAKVLGLDRLGELDRALHQIVG